MNYLRKFTPSPYPACEHLRPALSVNGEKVGTWVNCPLAFLQSRNASYRVLFRYRGRLHPFTIGEMSQIDAIGIKAQAEELLRLLRRRRLIDLPAGCSIEEFLPEVPDIPIVLCFAVCISAKYELPLYCGIGSGKDSNRRL